MFTVFLQSEPFGCEHFKYDSLDEALKAIGRLFHAAKGDGVEREIGIRVNVPEAEED